MIKYITAILALFLMLSVAQAGNSKKIFKSNYDGIADLENVVGDSIFYSPVRFKVSKTGKITGTAFNTTTQKLVKVTGSIGKVKKTYGILYVGKASGKFSDGTRWKAEVQAQKGVTGKVIQGKVRRGQFSGSLTLTNL